MLAAARRRLFRASAHRRCAVPIGSARGDDGNREPLRQPGVGVARVAVFRPVVVHRREQNLARSAPLRLGGPGEKLRSVSRRPPCVVTRHRPSACFASIATTTNWLPYFEAMSLMSSGLRTAALLTVTLSAPAASSRPASSTDAMPPPDGERNIDALGDAGDQLGECAPAFLRRADVEVDQLVGSLFGVASPQFDRVTHVLQTEKVDPLDGLSVLDVEAGYDAFG